MSQSVLPVLAVNIQHHSKKKLLHPLWKAIYQLVNSYCGTTGLCEFCLRGLNKVYLSLCSFLAVMDLCSILECLTMETQLSEASWAKNEDVSTSMAMKKNKDKDLNDNVSGIVAVLKIHHVMGKQLASNISF